VGIVGELLDASRAGRLGFAREGDAVALIAAASWRPSLAASELAKLRGEAPEGELPAADLGELRAMHAAIRQAVRSGALRSAHDVAEGGLAVALAECCVASGLGAEVTVETSDAALFGEGPGAFVVSGPRDAFAAFGAAATLIGVVGGDELRIAAHGVFPGSGRPARSASTRAASVRSVSRSVPCTRSAIGASIGGPFSNSRSSMRAPG
jgi:phosphoribosylformylglycinamidine synthase